MRKFALIAAAVWVASAAPALAITPEQAECPDKMAPAGLGKMVLDDVEGYAKTGKKDPRTTEGLEQTFNACLEATRVPAAERDEYWTYVRVRIGRDEVLVQLKPLGIDPGIIDRKLDLGPGKSNRELNMIPGAELGELVDLLEATGVSKKLIGDRGGTLIGYYIYLTATMYKLLA